MKKRRVKLSKTAGLTISAALLLSSVPFSSHAETSPETKVLATEEENQNVKETLKQEPQLGFISEGETRTITLLTGDVVTVTGVGDGKTVIDVKPTNGIEDRSRIMTINNETYVIPQQAMEYVAADQIDMDLFNLTKLLREGYDDAKEKTVPVIMQYDENKTDSMTSVPKAPVGSEQVHVLESINSVSVTTNKKHAKDFWKAISGKSKASVSRTSSPSYQLGEGIEKVWLDEKVEATLSQSVPQVGAPIAWNAGYNGKGTTVAVLDTGIDKNHPDISGRLDEAVNFVPGEDISDYNSHGTHVASTVLGTGAASNGVNKGVAPGARLIVGKVLGNNGSGLNSWIIDGMEWASHKAKIISMSLGSSEASDGTDPMSQAVNRLSEQTGSLFVIAAGNNGGEGTVGAPGAADAALTVGAVSKTDQLASFSSKGPRIKDMAIKPDISAPGVSIMAARSQVAASGSGMYMSKNGTSMATPHVAGAAAILLQQHPDWTGQEIKDALMSSSKQLQGLTPYQTGTGRLDIPAAINNGVYATGSVSFGLFDWPHDEKEPVVRTVTYKNDTNTDVTLNIASTFTDAAGKKAPEGLLTHSKDIVMIPAKGSTSIKVAVDVSKGLLGARYQGYLAASVGGKVVTRTSLAMVKEEEHHNLTIKAIDRDGSPNFAYAVLYNFETAKPQLVKVNGSVDIRLLPGAYSVTSIMDVDTNTDHQGVAFVGNPEFELTKDQTIELDGRKTHEIKVETPKKSEASFRRMEYTRVTAKGGTGESIELPKTVDKVYAAPTDKVENGSFEMDVRWRMIKPILTMKLNGHEFDDLPQTGSTNLDGTYQLPTIYAGKGAATDYEGLDAKGKAVVIYRSDSVKPAERAQAAIAAGVKLLIVVNDDPRESSNAYVPDAYAKVPLAITSISGTEGEALVEAVRSGDIKLNVQGTENSPYLYDLIKVFNDSIPYEETVYAPQPDELARVDSRYYSDRPAIGTEWRFDFRPNRSVDRRLSWEVMNLPAEREEWVSAPEGSTWYQKSTVEKFDQLRDWWEMRHELKKYQPGQQLESDWFKPVIEPSFSSGFIASYRDKTMLYVSTHPWGDSQVGHAGFFGNGGTHSKLYQGSSLIAEKDSESVIVYYSNLIPKERKQYTMISDSKRDPNVWSKSTQTHTEWTFWSEYSENKPILPMLDLHFDVKTDLAGNVPAARSTKLKLSATHLPNAVGAGTIEGATLEVSFDEGKTWKQTNLNREGEDWVADIKLPNNPGGSASLRASAWDDVGNSIKQDVIKAFGLH
ncbi:S8 family serine peptidase [Gottfriedia sp. NPDC057948]|uniref:S8 family peptidase n=1 Tax=Gottfriedia sp. NPDC057948 TaxID=3346287 RepID=UPI0036DC804F